jgi:hypothetical protein
MALGRSGQRPAGEHADGNNPDAGRLGVIEQPSIILRWIVRWQLAGRGRIEHIVDDLSAVKDAGVNHPMQRRRVTDCCKPKEARLPLLAQSLERWHHVTEHLLNAERFSAIQFR